MTSALLGKAGKKLFEKHLEQYAPSDPMYEFYVDDRGKQRRRKRELPAGLSTRDAKILRAVNARASRLDRGFNLCGFRFGWTFFIGLVPILGDVTNIGLNYFFVVRKAKQAELPDWLVRRMQFNNVVSGAISFIPLVGDVLLAVWKANSRNAALLEEFLRIRGEEFIKIRAEGGDPDKIQKENAKAARKKGKGKGKGGPIITGRSEEVVPGVTKHDAQQVKPGAGREKGEKVTDNTLAASPAAGASTNEPIRQSPGSSDSRVSRSSGRSFGSRSLGFVSSWGRKGKPQDCLAPPAGRRGSRFLEDFDMT